MAGKVLYTAEAHVTGGREDGHGRTSDGVLDLDIRPPADGETGTNPEQLFAVGYGACFAGAVAAAARREDVDTGEVAIDAKVDLKTTEDRGFAVGAELDVTLPGIDDPEQAKELVAAAHQICPYSHATRGNIDVKLTANGEPVA